MYLVSSRTKPILLSDLEVFELTNGETYGLAIGVAADERETMVTYVVSLRQFTEISCTLWKTHLDSLKKAEMLKHTATKKLAVFNIYNCYGKWKDPLSCKVSDYSYKPRTSEQTMNECNSGLYDLLNDIEYLTSRGMRSLLSSHQFKKVQDKYQLPTAFDSTEAHATATGFAVGCDYWSAIHGDYYYYYPSLSCVSEKVNDRSI
jgi:hypothetical protein